MRRVSARTLLLTVIAVVGAAALVWLHRPHLTPGAAKSGKASVPRSPLYGHQASIHVLGAVLTTPLCRNLEISRVACSLLRLTVTFRDPATDHLIGKTVGTAGAFSLPLRITLGRSYRYRAETVWHGRRYRSQPNTFVLGRPQQLVRVVLSY